jgi:hypothetical protein
VSQWGVFKTEWDGEPQFHVAPVLPDGRLPVNHSMHEFCPCGPREELISQHVSLWIHQDAERGGANA